jgi:hypothetical protein
MPLGLLLFGYPAVFKIDNPTFSTSRNTENYIERAAGPSNSPILRYCPVLDQPRGTSGE